MWKAGWLEPAAIYVAASRHHRPRGRWSRPSPVRYLSQLSENATRAQNREPMDGTAEIRVGLVGYGLAGAAFHAPLIATTPGMRLVAIVTAQPERATAARSAYPAAEVLPDADRLWERRDEVDVVVVATPNRTHAPLGHAALAAGLPVVIDKPLAPTAEAARALVADAERRGL